MFVVAIVAVATEALGQVSARAQQLVVCSPASGPNGSLFQVGGKDNEQLE